MSKQQQSVYIEHQDLLPSTHTQDIMFVDLNRLPLQPREAPGSRRHEQDCIASVSYTHLDVYKRQVC